MRFRSLLAPFSLALLIAAPLAASAPIVNITKQTWVRPDEKPLTLGQVKAAIIRGGLQRNWMAESAKENSLVLHLTVRRHQVWVDVAFTEKDFSITYLRSENMDYEKDASGRETIHSKYNHWIRNLVQDIQKELVR